MRPIFLFLAILTVAGAMAAMTARQLVHGALYLAGAFAGLAIIYLGLGAQFVGLVQVLVYVGAVAILIVFAILLTRSSESPQAERWSRLPWLGWGIGAAVFGALALAILNSGLTQSPPWPAQSVSTDATVLSIGRTLMMDHVVALEAIGLLLTAALIGGVMIAMDEGQGPATPKAPESLRSGGGITGSDGSPGGAG